MKKVFTVTLVLMLAFCLLLTACSNNSGGGTTTPPASSGGDTTPTTPSSSGGEQPAGGPEYEKVTIKLGMSGTERGIDYICSTYLKEQVEEATGGDVKIDLYPNNVLSGGNQAESINLLTQGGAMEIGCFSGAVFCNLDPIFQTCMLPFIFKDYDAVEAALDGGGNTYYTKRLAEYGLVNLGGMHSGIKQWTNNKEEKRQPSDYVNFKMRIPGGEVSSMTWKCFGADPISMSWSEVYTALQQGTVDGHENSFQTLYSGNIFEVQKYITEANYQYDGYWFVANQASWDKFSPALQELLTEKCDEAVRYARAYLREAEKDIKQELIERGNIITELTDEEYQAFYEASQPVRDHFFEIFGAEAYDAWGIAHN